MATRKVRVQVLSLNINSDGSGALITKPSKENPSPNGVHVLRQGQVARLAQRALGVANPIALKHTIAMSNGSTYLVLDCEDVKAGDVFVRKNPDGTETEDKYTKDWTKTSNEELELGAVASAKIAEISLGAAFSNPMMFAAPTQQTRQRVEAHVDEQTEQTAGEQTAGEQTGEIPA